MTTNSALYAFALTLSFSSMLYGDAPPQSVPADAIKSVDQEIVSELGAEFTFDGQNNQGQPCKVTVIPTSYGHEVKLVESRVSSFEPGPITHIFQSFQDEQKAQGEKQKLKKAYFEDTVSVRDFNVSFTGSATDSRGYPQNIENSLTIGGRTTRVPPTDSGYKRSRIGFIAISKTVSSDSLFAETLFSNNTVSCFRLLY